MDVGREGSSSLGNFESVVLVIDVVHSKCGGSSRGVAISSNGVGVGSSD